MVVLTKENQVHRVKSRRLPSNKGLVVKVLRAHKGEFLTPGQVIRLAQEDGDVFNPPTDFYQVQQIINSLRRTDGYQIDVKRSGNRLGDMSSYAMVATPEENPVTRPRYYVAGIQAETQVGAEKLAQELRQLLGREVKVYWN